MSRVAEMVEQMAAELIAMRRQGRKPGTDPAGDLRRSLLSRWPDLTSAEFTEATLGLAARLSRAETAARPANEVLH